MKPPVGFIGLGLMGRPMATNLLKAGYELTVWNRTASRTDSLVAQGAKCAASPKELAAASEVIFTIVSDPPALESVLWGEAGVFEGLRRGSVLVESSTVSPEMEKRAAAAAAALGADFSGGALLPAERGARRKANWSTSSAATRKRFSGSSPSWARWAKKWFHVGPVGAGQTVKVAMNLLFALQVEGFAEALALVQRAGIPGKHVLELMQSSMGHSGLLDLKGPMMLKGEYKPSFPLRLMHKDVGLALDLANQLGVPLPAGAATREVLSAVKGSVKEDVDFSALAEFWRKS